MAIISLENIITKGRILALSALASLSLSCYSCENDDLSKVICDPLAAEICNNGLDDNCNGILDELCDQDGDGYCTNQTNIQIVYQPGAVPSVCPNTFKNCTTAEPCPEESLVEDCVDDPAYFYQECGGLPRNISEIDCSRYSACAQCIYPGAIEYCDLQDNDCDKVYDNDFIEKRRLCGEGLGEYLELDGIGSCRAGEYTQCLNGELICTGVIAPAEKELCNGRDDTCGQEIENVLTGAQPCYYGYREDQSGNQIKIDLRLGHSSIGQGPCMSGVELCFNGVLGGDYICHGAILPEYEVEQKCDCQDDNCNGEADEGLHSGKKLEFSFMIDNSGSMANRIGYIKYAISNIDLYSCSTNPDLSASIVLIGERTTNGENINPLLRRSSVTFAEFSSRFENDIPSYDGPGNEANLNSIAYAACDVLEQLELEALSRGESFGMPEVCRQIDPYNSLKPDGTANIYNIFYSLNQHVFNIEAKKYIVLLSDEQAQWVNTTFNPRTGTIVENFPVLNQQEVAQLADQAGIKVLIFTELVFDSYDLNNTSAQGYGYFRDYGGEIHNIGLRNLDETIEAFVIGKYCQGE